MQYINKNYIILILSVVFLVIYLLSCFRDEFNYNNLPSFLIQKKEDFDLDPSEISIVTSLVDPSTISKIVKKHYTIEGPLKCSLLNVGINDIYLIETENKKYVLRLSRVDKYFTMTTSEYKFELEWLEFLNEHKVPISYPIRRSDNQLHGLINAPEGPRYVTLFSYADGTTDMNLEQAFILGKNLAQLHLVSNQFKTSLSREHLNIDNLVNRSVKRIKTFLEKTDEKKSAIIDEMAKGLIRRLATIDLTKVELPLQYRTT